MVYRLGLPMGVNDPIPCDVFAHPECRLTVSTLMCIHGKLLLVQPTRAKRDGYHRWWVLPQEGVELYDETLGHAMLRGVYEELRYDFSEHLPENVTVLGDFMNPVPLGRKDSGKIKQIIFLAGSFHHFSPRLNMFENADYRLVASWQELDELMTDAALHRLHKYVSTCEMVLHACEYGLLPWEVPGKVIDACHMQKIGTPHNYDHIRW